MAGRSASTAELRERARTDTRLVLEEHWPAGRVPVDPVEIARSMGLSVFTTQLGDDTWGMIVGSGDHDARRVLRPSGWR